jgi:hypothetical protein
VKVCVLEKFAWFRAQSQKCSFAVVQRASFRFQYGRQICRLSKMLHMRLICRILLTRAFACLRIAFKFFGFIRRTSMTIFDYFFRGSNKFFRVFEQLIYAVNFQSFIFVRSDDDGFQISLQIEATNNF